MIRSARPVVTPVFCCFVLLDLKSGDGQHVQKNGNYRPCVGRPSGSINSQGKN